jgi:hypothetical protein
MSSECFYTQLNGLTKLLGRFELCDDNSVESIDENADKLTHADMKVFFCNYSNSHMIKGFELFGNKMEPSFSEQELVYIQKYRLERLNNAMVKGFYADVCCNAQSRPNGKYADDVIHNYICFTESYHAKDSYDLHCAIRSLIYNCQKFKKDKKSVWDAVTRFLISDAELNDKMSILIDVYESSFIGAADLRDFIIEKGLHQNLSENYRTNKAFFLMLGNIIDKSNSQHVGHVYRKLADNQDYIISQNPTHIATVNDVLEKMEFLKKGGFDIEADECNKQFLWLKENGEGLNEFSRSYSIPNYYFQKYVDLIVKSEIPIKTIAEDDRLLPSDNCVGIDLFMDLDRLGILRTNFDISGNPHTQQQYDSLQIDNAFIQNYHLLFHSSMQLSLKTLISNGAFSVESINAYLSDSWLGWPRMAVNGSLKKTHESWIPILLPSVRQITEEIIKEVQSFREYKGDYVCAIDSLTLKIEGCIRDACRRLNIQTVKENRDEIPLEVLLTRLEEKCNGTAAPINHKTLRMLQCVLTKHGQNLRNILAHGLSSSMTYDMQNAITILHTILKVSTIKVPHSSTGCS